MNPELGAFSQPVKLVVTVSGVEYVFSSPAITFTPVGKETVRALSGTGSFTPVGPSPPPPPPPPPPPVIHTLAPNPVVAGQPVTIRGGGFSGAAAVFWGSLALPIGASHTDTEIPVTAPSVSMLTSAPVTVQTTAGVSNSVLLAVSPIPVPPPPPPPGVINVRDKGATGNGTTDDRAAIQAAIDGAPEGSTIHFPPGRYRITDAIKLYNKSNIGFLGDGPESVIYMPQSNGLTLSNGNALTGLSVRRLKFSANDHWVDSQPTGSGVFLYGPRGTIIEDCDFEWCGHGIYEAGDGDPNTHGSTKGTRILNCRIMGWQVLGLFLNGDNVVRDCVISQQNPYNLHRGSHGIYIHSGASNVLVEDTLIENCVKYAAQVYGEQLGTITKNVTFRRCTVRHCYNGIILAHSQMGAADIDGCLIEDSVFDTFTEGAALWLRAGKNVVVRNNTVRNSTTTGISVGLFAPWDENEIMGPTLVENNLVENCFRGIWVCESNKGTFIDVTISKNDLSRNTQPLLLDPWNGVPPNVTLVDNILKSPALAGPGEGQTWVDESEKNPRDWIPT